jgi:HEAT repeat protein
VETLGTSSHGLLLFEENRRALCRIGSAGAKPLIAAAGRRDPRGQPVSDASPAVRVLGDLGDPSTIDQLAGMLTPTAPESYRVALAETLLHLGQQQGEKALIEILVDKGSAITARRRAAEVLGWLGDPAALGGKIESICRGDKVTEEVLCMSVALAHSRLSGPEGLPALDRLLRSRRDNRAMASNLQTYRVRLETVQSCGDDLPCLQKVLSSRENDWRRRERAALELGRRGQANDALLLARQLQGSHPQVKQAILVALERLLLRQMLDAGQIARVAAALDRFLRESNDTDSSKETDTKKGDSTTPVAITSQLLCLGQRFKRTREGRR